MPASFQYSNIRHILPIVALAAALRFLYVSFHFSLSGVLALFASGLAVLVHYTLDTSTSTTSTNSTASSLSSSSSSSSSTFSSTGILSRLAGDVGKKTSDTSAKNKTNNNNNKTGNVTDDENEDEDDEVVLAKRLMKSDEFLDSWLAKAEMPLLYNAFSASECNALRAFSHLKENSQCIFAKKSRIWGSRNWDDFVSFDINIYRSVPMFMQFCQALASDVPLDGFLFAIPSDKYGNTLEKFAKSVNRTLTILSHFDPAKVKIMEKSYVGQKGWAFEFAREPFFVTTFAPFYPPNHSRYAFGASTFSSSHEEAKQEEEPVSPSTVYVKKSSSKDKLAGDVEEEFDIITASEVNSLSSQSSAATSTIPTIPTATSTSTSTSTPTPKNLPNKDKESSPAEYAEKFAYILLQPERSFVRHNIGDDTPVTNWSNPVTVRDKIRVNFANAGRAYIIPPSIHYPTANHIVEAVNVHEDPVVEFWKTKFDL